MVVIYMESIQHNAAINVLQDKQTMGIIEGLGERGCPHAQL